MLPDNLRFLKLLCRARSRNVSFSQDYLPLELAKQLIVTNAYIGEGYYDRSTACARDACFTFSEIAKHSGQVRAGVIAFVLKSEHK